MNSRERFIATVERKPVDRPACWLGDPTPEAVPALCDYYHVDNIKELKKVAVDLLKKIKGKIAELIIGRINQKPKQLLII